MQKQRRCTDLLHGNRPADQRLCFCYIDSTIPLLSKLKKFKPLAIFCACTAQFVSKHAGNLKDRFSHSAVQFCFFSELCKSVREQDERQLQKSLPVLQNKLSKTATAISDCLNTKDIAQAWYVIL